MVAAGGNFFFSGSSSSSSTRVTYYKVISVRASYVLTSSRKYVTCSRHSFEPYIQVSNLGSKPMLFFS